MTRDSVQGFIDGYLAAGGDKSKIEYFVTEWMDKHPVYPQTKSEQAVVILDIESYRGAVRAAE